MEKIITKVPITKIVDAGLADKITYVTRDGVIYEKEDQARKHEKLLDEIEFFQKKYHPKKIRLEEDYIAIFIEELTPETIKYLEKRYYNFSEKDLSVGWNLIREEDCGDSSITYCINAKVLLEEMKTQMIDLENLIITKF